MILTVDQLTEVWNLGTVAFSSMSGLLVGYFAVGRYASDPAYASNEARPLEYGLMTGVLTVSVGLIFFGFQVIGTWLDGDPEWTRVVSRLVLWVLYATMIGLGTWARVHGHVESKKRLAHKRAVKELSEGEKTE